MKEIVHHLHKSGNKTTCGFPVKPRHRITGRAGETTCRNCHARLAQQNREVYWDYHRGQTELNAAEIVLNGYLHDFRNRYGYISCETYPVAGEIAFGLRFWIRVPKSNAKTYTLNTSHTATPNNIDVRSFNEGEMTVILGYVEQWAEQLHLRVRRSEYSSTPEFKFKPYFHPKEKKVSS